MNGLACNIGGKSRHPRYGRPQDILAEPLLAITSHPPGPVTTPPYKDFPFLQAGVDLSIHPFDSHVIG
ncbi:hypothetical protein, partial [Paraburkholderia sp. SIMBA_054]|uniref:hypothetical protein n=1 Tax=Paraburkholderia sp. SIMBA_054 TaxID=3085795 RepID=UPI00397D7228